MTLHGEPGRHDPGRLHRDQARGARIHGVRRKILVSADLLAQVAMWLCLGLFDLERCTLSSRLDNFNNDAPSLGSLILWNALISRRAWLVPSMTEDLPDFPGRRI